MLDGRRVDAGRVGGDAGRPAGAGVGSAQAERPLRVVVHVNIAKTTDEKVGLGNVGNTSRPRAMTVSRPRSRSSAMPKVSDWSRRPGPSGRRRRRADQTGRPVRRVSEHDAAAIDPARGPAPRGRHRPLGRLRDRPQAAGRLLVLQALTWPRRAPEELSMMRSLSTWPRSAAALRLAGLRRERGRRRLRGPGGVRIMAARPSPGPPTPRRRGRRQGPDPGGPPLPPGLRRRPPAQGDARVVAGRLPLLQAGQ